VRTPKEYWPTTEALVYSVEWFEATHDDYANYLVVYSYRVGDQRYTGEFRDYGTHLEGFLHRNDTISVRYSPENPEKSYFPQRNSALNRRLLAIGIGAGFAVIVMLIVYFSGGFR
jgi:hypothetical protein